MRWWITSPKTPWARLVRALLVVLAGVALTVLVGGFTLPLWGPAWLSATGLAVVVPRVPVPPPPVITAPRGALPTCKVGLHVWGQTASGHWVERSSGFVLLVDGAPVGVATRHANLDVGVVAYNRYAMRPDDVSGWVFEATHLLGPPGVYPYQGYAFTQDYLLFAPAVPPVAAYALTPDPRGQPQPGERIVLYNGLPAGGTFTGTVTVVGETYFWAQMDEAFAPHGMSGSPVLSAHTGQVVGMAVVGQQGTNATYVGFHPVGNLVRLAHQAETRPALNGLGK